MASTEEHVVRRRREERERVRESDKGARRLGLGTLLRGSPKSFEGVSAKRDYCVEAIYWTEG